MMRYSNKRWSQCLSRNRNQEAWQVCVYQGDDPNALNNILVGRFLIEGLSAVPAGNEVLCRMDLDLDGILRVTATEKRTGLAKHITIESATTAMTDAQVAEARRHVLNLLRRRRGSRRG